MQRCGVCQQEGRCLGVGGVAKSNANHLGRPAQIHAQAKKVFVLGDQGCPSLKGKTLNLCIAGPTEPLGPHMQNLIKGRSESGNEALGEIFIQQQPPAHASAAATTKVRSRSAA